MAEKENNKDDIQGVESGNSVGDGHADAQVEESAAAGDVSEAEVDLESKDPLVIMEEKLRVSETASKESYNRLLRATAEFDNYKKRSVREIAEFRKFANESLIKELLPVIDNLERAVASAGQHADSNKGVVEGVEMTLAEIFKVLEKFNLKSLESEGKTFDPNFHQAVMQEETDECPENTVIKVMQTGYILHDRLIRPAMVVVSKAKPVNNENQNDVEESIDQTDL